MSSVASDSVKEKDKTSMWSWVRFILLLFVVFFVFRYVIGIIIINGNSMNPTLDHQDVILTSNIFYTPERNDVILFRDENGFDVIKRVVGMPGDTVEIRSGTVYLNGGVLEEDYITGIPNDMPLIEVNEGYFVMGDNRTPGESLDSRSEEIGLIEDTRVKGEVIFSLWPIGMVNK